MKHIGEAVELEYSEKSKLPVSWPGTPPKYTPADWFGRPHCQFRKFAESTKADTDFGRHVLFLTYVET